MSLVDNLRYENGCLFWTSKVAKNTNLSKPAGRKRSTGYYELRVNGTLYYRHRLVWIMFKGDIPTGMQIDHINGIKGDDRIENLRLCTHAENIWNRKKNKNNFIGHKNICLQGKRYEVRVNKDNKCNRIGVFDSLDEAIVAATNARQILHGEFSRE